MSKSDGIPWEEISLWLTAYLEEIARFSLGVHHTSDSELCSPTAKSSTELQNLPEQLPPLADPGGGTHR